jgi:trigger factor
MRINSCPLFRKDDLMTYSVVAVNNYTKKFVFNFENLDISKEIQTALVNKQKTASLKGFRTGKAPLSMIEKLYRPEVEMDALNNFVNGQFMKALETEKLRVVGRPNFENFNYDPGKKVSFEAVVEIFPEFELQDYSHLKFAKDKVNVTADDVEKQKKSLLENKAEVVAIEDASVKAKLGHIVVINFEGERANGERPANMKAEEFELELGSNQFIPGFEEKLVGSVVSKGLALHLSFPADYHMEDLRNEKVTFHVDLLEIKEKKYPEFTDELVKEFGFESVADFETKQKEQLAIAGVEAAERKLNDEIVKALVELHGFEVPVALIHEQEHYLQEEMKPRLKQQGFTDQMMEKYFENWHHDFHQKAEFQVKAGLILDKLAKKNEVTVKDSDLEAHLEKIAGRFGGVDFATVKKFYFEDAQRKNSLVHMVTEEKTLDAVKKSVEVKA